MSIIAQTENGFLICSKSYFDNIYCSVSTKTCIKRHIVFRDSFFDIKTPFFTNSMAKKCGQIMGCENISAMKKKKKRKENLIKNMLEYSEIIDFIKKNIGDLINGGKIAGILEDSAISPVEWFENNGNAREAAKEIMNYINPTLSLELHFENISPDALIQKFGDDEYMIPAKSKFHLCDITTFIKNTDEKFDVIVIDPPWVNRSVKRKKSYQSLSYDLLKSLTLQKIANPGCLIVVWITNSSSAASFVLDELFPKCNVIRSSMWHWCKITKKGDFVYPIESHHKKPYENLILGRVEYDHTTDVKAFKEIDSKNLIVSIPSSIHSHKPPLTEILKPYVKENARYLELFARYLLPGFTSVGNEVLKLQNTKLFDMTSLSKE